MLSPCIILCESVIVSYFLILVISNRSAIGLELIKSGYSTKTPYFFVHPPDLEVKEDDLYNVNTDKLTCGAVHVSAVIRHGARNPSESDTNTISDIHTRIKNNIDKAKFQSLVEWSNSFPHNDEKSLNDAGEEEQKQLSQRVAQRLKSLFLEEDLSAIRIMVSSAKRSESSALAFYGGFIEQLQFPEESLEEFDSEVNDEILRYYTLCQKYKDSVENNKTAYMEYKTFSTSDFLSSVIQKVNIKLGLNRNILEPRDIKAMFVICGSEMAVFKTSPWCDLFDEDDLEVLQYWTDIKKYYKYGPAHEITREQSCPLVSEIFTVMDDAIAVMERTEDDKDVEGYLVANFMFGHAETLSPLYAALGLFNDSVPLKADNFNQHKNRLYRSSNILPFSANIMFVLYECEENEELLNNEEEYEEIQEDYLIQVLVNEKPILMPGCKDILCSYSELRERYVELIENCHFDYVCNPHLKQHDEL